MHDIQEVFGLDDRVAVVTGGASGIGRAVAEVLASAGARVVVGDFNAAGAEETAAAIRKLGGEALAHEVDVSKREQTRALVERAVEAHQQVDARVVDFGYTDVGRALARRAGGVGDDFGGPSREGVEDCSFPAVREAEYRYFHQASRVRARTSRKGGWGSFSA